MIAVMIVVSIVNEIVAACYSSDSPVFPCGMEVEVNNELRLLRKTHQHLCGSFTPCYHFPFFFFNSVTRRCKIRTEMLVGILRKHTVHVLSQAYRVLSVVGSQPLFVVDQGKLLALLTWREVITDDASRNCIHTMGQILTYDFCTAAVKLILSHTWTS